MPNMYFIEPEQSEEGPSVVFSSNNDVSLRFFLAEKAECCDCQGRIFDIANA